MTQPEIQHLRPAYSDPDVQRAVWFLGALVTTQLDSAETSDCLAVLEHRGRNGYNSPLHRHLHDDETFLVLDGSVELVADGEEYTAQAGSTIFLPKHTVHGFVVASAAARFLTLHNPGGFDRFTNQVGVPTLVDATRSDLTPPPEVVAPTPEELTRIAAGYGIEILGPPPVQRTR
ncbi:cupin domain-containing protein [Kineococcus sp. GCM10028916]|uniref:cupin domain-containing protein n=1 Tax=Kineococcus sp. GCM10028916 TaxID=3273394 RepID=UPI00362F0BD6